MIDRHAYLYGGEEDNGTLAGGEVHIVTLPLPIKRGRSDNGEADYKCVPALGESLDKAHVKDEDQGGEDELGAGQVEGHFMEQEVPVPRKWHSAVSVGRKMYVYGGKGVDDTAIAENTIGRIWIFDTESLTWSVLDPVEGTEETAPEGRWGHGCASSDQPPPMPMPTTRSEAPGLGSRIGQTIGDVTESIATLVTGKADETITRPHGSIVIYGGVDSNDKYLNDAWCFDIARRRWTRLPDPPSMGPSQLASGRLAITDSQVFLIAHPDPTRGGDINSLQLDLPLHDHPHPYQNSNMPELQGQQDPDESETLQVTATPEQRIQQQLSVQKSPPRKWEAHAFPTDPVIPGPSPRHGAALLPIKYRNGRQYLLYAFGAHIPHDSSSTSKADPPSAPDSGAAEQYYSTMYTYQLPSPASSMSVSPAKIKDAIRSKAGADTGERSWAEAIVAANEEVGDDGQSGKAHPGPRGWFASAAIEGANNDGACAVLWGGRNAKGGVEGDGWIVSVDGV